MKLDDILPFRKLGDSILYICSAIFFMVNLGVIGTTGFDAIDLFCIIAGWSTWVLAATHSVYLKAVALKKPAQKNEETAQPLVSQSTHSLVNAALFSASAVFFIAGDAYNSSTPLDVRASRLAGSSLWLMSALTYVWLGWHERRGTRPAGLSPSIFHFVCESEYLAAGILYAAAIWLTNPVQGLKAAGNICWLLASLDATVQTFQALPSRQTEADLEMGETTAPAPK